MKKFISVLLCVMMVTVLAAGILTACNKDGATDETYKVTFFDGQKEITSVQVKKDTAITLEQIPAKPAGHETQQLIGWYIDGETLIEAGKTVISKDCNAFAKYGSGSTTGGGDPGDDEVSAPDTFYIRVSTDARYNVTGIKASGYKVDEVATFKIVTTNPDLEIEEVVMVSTQDQKLTPDNEGNYKYTVKANAILNVKVKNNNPTAADAVIERLFMKGEMVHGEIRAIYAVLTDDYVNSGATFTWSSDAPTVVDLAKVNEATMQNGPMPEAILSAQAPGTANITCTMIGQTNITKTYTVTVRGKNEGVALSDEVYNKLKGSVTLKSTEQYLKFDPKYTDSVEQSRYLTSIYEDIVDDPYYDNELNLTDAYQFIERSTQEEGTDNNVLKRYKYVSNQRYVCTERVNVQNEVVKEQAVKTDSDGDSSIRWASSVYFNVFDLDKNNVDVGYYSTADLWRSFDGGNKYYFMGTYSQATNICLFLYLKDLVPDEMYIQVTGDTITLNVSVDPGGYDGARSYKNGWWITTTFSDFGTSKINHVTPYQKEDYHDGLTTAVNNMAALKNYKASVYIGNELSVYTYTEDTIDVAVMSAGLVTERTGIHKVNDNQYYEYKVVYKNENEVDYVQKTRIHDAVWEGQNSSGSNIVRYPTFAFSPLIFEKTSTTNKYQSRSKNGVFVQYTCYNNLGIGYSFPDDGTLKLDSNGHVTEVATTARFMGETVDTNIRVVFEAFNTATTGLDFASAHDIVTPSAWTDKVNASFKSFGLTANPLPYLYPGDLGGSFIEEGWKTDFTRAPQSSELKYIYIETGEFAPDDPDQPKGKYTKLENFVTQYEAALVAAGWTKTNDKDEDGYYFYTKESDGYTYRVTVGIEKKSYGYLNTARIRVYNDNISYPSIDID